MNIIRISSLLGVAGFVLQAAMSKETLKVNVTVWPPGSNLYLGESVLLQCSVESNSSFKWSYVWQKQSPHAAPAPTPNPRHLVSGDSYSITSVTREDAGSYQCQATLRESNSTSVGLLSQPVALSVSELFPPSLLTLTPSSRQIFQGERFTVQCPLSLTNSISWKLRHFPLGHKVRISESDTGGCSPLGGSLSADKSNKCAFVAAGVNSGLYWCEGTEGRSNAINITVSNGTVIMKTPAFPVSEGGEVVLYCQYWTGNHNKTTFFKNGAKIIANSSTSSDGVIKMTIEKVTQEDEGLYKCASQDGKMESPESWLSVSVDQDGTAASTSGSWKWIVLSCGLVALFFIPLTVWLIYHYGFHTFCTCRCCQRPFSKVDLPALELPATKQDVTEVQWDLSWMEMSSLLDKQLYPGS